ncbi:hypothetical protein MMC07_007481 [Pseudocyphellaria aurata]|nr:hypothetical protein [Pseudocyphellaria aurata]
MDPSKANTGVMSDDLAVQCPAHTTKAALLRKVDFKILPIITILYMMAFLDRTNLGNALTLGLPRDLRLKGNEPNVAITIFFVPYILFEIPSNLLMKKVKPRIWLSTLAFLFGFMTTMQGLVQNYSGLLAVRFFLGLAETGMYPGCFYLISMWYKRREALKRFTLFYNSTVLASAFGGLLASAIANMDGVRGYSGWRWIFILEGILTCILGVMGFFLVADFPEDVKWLKEDERTFLRERLRIEQGDPKATKKLRPNDFMLFLQDPKFFLGGMMYLSSLVPTYGFSYFTPTIIRTYGYGPVSTQIHTVPPAAATLVATSLIAWASDRARHRFLFLIFALCVGIVGVSILLHVHDNFHVEYAAIFLASIGNNSALPIIMCWYTMNLRGHLERSIGTAWVIGFGNVGAIIAAFSFLSSDAPFYHKGYSLAMGGYAMCILSATAYLLMVWTANRNEKLAGAHASTDNDELAAKEDSGTEPLFM